MISENRISLATISRLEFGEYSTDTGALAPLELPTVMTELAKLVGRV